MLARQYYWMLKEKYHKYVSKSQFIYIYTDNGIVDYVLFKTRKQKYIEVRDVPHTKLDLIDDNENLPQNVIVQIKFSPLEFKMYEG